MSPKLQKLFLLSIPVFIFHGLEEYLTGFYATDNVSRFFFGYAENMTSLQSSFLTFQVMIGILMIVAYLLLTKRWVLQIATFFGLLFFFELHHFVKAISVGGYYPGLITALFFPILGFLYWKELLKEWSKRK